MVEERRLPVPGPLRDDLGALLGARVLHVEARERFGRRVLVEEGPQLGTEGELLLAPGEAHGQPGNSSRKGGSPGSDFAKRSPLPASIDSIVHGLSLVIWVIGRQPWTIWQTPPWIFTT